MRDGGSVRGRGHVWWGACMAGGRVWRGACMGGGMHGRRCACNAHPQQILRDAVNERAVRILLECMLVFFDLFRCFM